MTCDCDGADPDEAWPDDSGSDDSDRPRRPQLRDGADTLLARLLKHARKVAGD